MAFVLSRKTKSFEIAVTGTASAAKAIPYVADVKAAGRRPILTLTYKGVTEGTGCYVCGGASTVAASATVTSGDLPDGNVFIEDGAIMVSFQLDDGVTYLSAISEDGADTGTLYCAISWGEP